MYIKYLKLSIQQIFLLPHLCIYPIMYCHFYHWYLFHIFCNIAHVINFDAQIFPAWPWVVLSEAVLFTFSISILNLLIVGNGNSLPTKIFIMCI